MLARPPVRIPDDRSARDQEREVMEAWLAARVGSRLRLVEEQLRAQGTVGPVVERPFGACLEPLAEPEDRHELVVVLLGRGEIRDADPDVVDESGLGHGHPRRRQRRRS